MEHVMLVLNIDLFSWKAVMNELDKEISKGYPEDFMVKQYENARQKCMDIEAAIKVLDKWYHEPF